MDKPLSPEVLLTTDELAALLKVTPRKLEKDRYEGIGIPFIRLSRRCVRYRLSDVTRYLDRCFVRHHDHRSAD